MHDLIAGRLRTMRSYIDIYSITIAVIALIMLALTLGVIVNRTNPLPPAFAYRAPDGSLVRGQEVSYPATPDTLCPRDPLRFTISLVVDAVPTLIVVRGAIRDQATGRTTAAFDMNDALTLGAIRGPIPYVVSRDLPRVPLALPLAPYKLAAGPYVLEVVAGDGRGAYNGFTVPFTIKSCT